MYLGVVPISPWQHQIGWADGPTEFPRRVMDPMMYAELAQELDTAGADFLFLPDKHVGNTTPPDPSVIDTWFEPVTQLSYLAAVTQNIGLVPTMSTSWYDPYPLARMILGLDHLSSGRAGWNAVSSHQGLEQLNFRHRPELSREEAKRRHAEFVGLVIQLWHSWEPGAIDVAGNQYSRPNAVRQVAHKGEFFEVEGHLNMSRFPQGQPVVGMAGKSESFMRTAAAEADFVFTMENDTATARDLSAFLRAEESRLGTSRTLLMPGLTVDLTGKSGPSAGHFHASGTPRQVAEQMAMLVEEGNLDGFIVLPQLLPDDLRIFSAEVLPELQRMGVRGASGSGCLRERLDLHVP